jgi:hypothetical protein
MKHDRLRSVTGLLLYGDPVSTARVAQELVAVGDSTMWKLLSATINSDDELRVRVRCLEVLAIAAGLADERIARDILAALRNGLAAPAV